MEQTRVQKWTYIYRYYSFDKGDPAKQRAMYHLSVNGAESSGYEYMKKKKTYSYLASQRSILGIL